MGYVCGTSMRAPPCNPSSSQQLNTAAGVSYVTPAASPMDAPANLLTSRIALTAMTGGFPPVGPTVVGTAPLVGRRGGDPEPLGSGSQILIASPPAGPSQYRSPKPYVLGAFVCRESDRMSHGERSSIGAPTLPVTRTAMRQVGDTALRPGPLRVPSLIRRDEGDDDGAVAPDLENIARAGRRRRSHEPRESD